MIYTQMILVYVLHRTEMLNESMTSVTLTATEGETGRSQDGYSDDSQSHDEFHTAINNTPPNQLHCDITIHF